MSLWFVVQDRLVLFGVFIAIILAAVFLSIATMKSRGNMPKSLVVTIFVICTIVIVLALFAIIFLASFGFNS